MVQMSAKDFYKQAQEKESKDDDQVAIADLSQAIRLNPDDIEAYSDRATIR